MRTFIAIEFNEHIKRYLYEKQQEIKKHCIKGNFTSMNNFHLTLRFLGEVQPDDIITLNRAIDEALSGCNAFELELNNIGQFLKGSKKIIWIGIKRSLELQELYKKLEASLEKKGYAKEDRGYNPHITLGREVLIDNFEHIKEQIAAQPEKFQVTGMSLMESTKVEGILTYRPIYHGDFM